MIHSQREWPNYLQIILQLIFFGLIIWLIECCSLGDFFFLIV